MSSHSNAKLAPRARPTTTKPKHTTADRVSFTRSLTTSMKQSSEWSSAAELQSSVLSWNQTADSLEANAGLMAHLRDQLLAAQLTQRVLTQNWAAGTKHVFSNVDVLAGGDVETIQGLGFVPVVRSAATAQSVPDHVTSAPGKLPGQAVVRWNPHVTRQSAYVVQHATDVADLATYSASVVCTRRHYLIAGASPASVVKVRIAAVDPTSPSGQTEWSDWSAVTVR